MDSHIVVNFVRSQEIKNDVFLRNNKNVLKINNIKQNEKNGIGRNEGDISFQFPLNNVKLLTLLLRNRCN